MKNFFTFLFVMTFLISHAQQNLVPNPSFEIFSQCPDTLGQINFATGWGSFRDDPDYYNACSPSTNFSVPNNTLLGYQQAASGNAYAGFYAYHNSATNLREYIGMQLSAPLVIGEKYFVSMKVSLADSMNFGVNKVGLLFSSTAFFDANSFGPTINFAHIYADSVIIDTINWTTISGWFTADSAYNYIAIGCFFDDDGLSKIRIDSYFNPLWGYEFAYYIVDDVYVSKDSVVGIKDYSLQSKVNIFSDLARSRIIISFTDSEIQEADVSIVNMSGEIEGKYHNVSSGYHINTSDFSTGIYIVSVKMRSITTNKKILVSK